MISLTVSLSDQEPERTRSLGIAHYSLNLTRELAASAAVSRLTVLGNGPIADRLNGLPAAIVCYDGPSRGRIRRLYWDQLGVYRAAGRTGCDWLLLPKGYAPWAVNCPVRTWPSSSTMSCASTTGAAIRRPGCGCSGPTSRKCLLATLRRAESHLHGHSLRRQPAARACRGARHRAASRRGSGNRVFEGRPAIRREMERQRFQPASAGAYRFSSVAGPTSAATWRFPTCPGGRKKPGFASRCISSARCRRG